MVGAIDHLGHQISSQIWYAISHSYPLNLSFPLKVWGRSSGMLPWGSYKGRESKEEMNGLFSFHPAQIKKALYGTPLVSYGSVAINPSFAAGSNISVGRYYFSSLRHSCCQTKTSPTNFLPGAYLLLSQIRLEAFGFRFSSPICVRTNQQFFPSPSLNFSISRTVLPSFCSTHSAKTL